MKYYLILSTLLIFLTINPSNELTPEEIGCDQDLMNAFKLEGHANPQFSKTIEICGNVRDNCCTLFDQILIIKLWKQYSTPLLAYRINKIIGLYRTIFSFHHYFFALNIETLPAHFYRERSLRYPKTTCQKVYDFRNDVSENDFVFITKSKKKSEYNRKLSNKVPLKLSAVAQVSFIKNASLKPNPRSLSDSNSLPVVIPQRELEGLQRIQRIKERFQKTIHTSLARVTRIITRKLNKIEQMKQRLQNRLNMINNKLQLSSQKDSTLNQIIPTSSPRSLDTQEKFFDDSGLKIMYGTKTSPKEGKTLLEEERTELQNTITTLDKNAKKILKYQNKDLLQKLHINFDNDKFAKFFDEIERKKLPYVPFSVSNIRIRRDPPSLKFDIPKVDCTKTRNTIYRRFYIVNEQKYRYCDNMLWALKKINLQDFINYIPNVHQSLVQFGGLRKSLYCAICDFTTQKNIDFKNKVVYYNQDFCEAYIWQFSEYFRWKDILFVEYLNFLFQTINCFDSKGEVVRFPFQTIVDQNFRKAFFYQRCFDSINTADWFKYCHFICKEFKLDTLSKLIEGDIAFLKEIASAIVSFLRKQNVSLKRLDLSKIHKVTKIDMLQNHHLKKVDKDIQDMIQSEFDQDLKASIKASHTHNSNTSKNNSRAKSSDITKSGIHSPSNYGPTQHQPEGRLLDDSIENLVQFNPVDTDPNLQQSGFSSQTSERRLGLVSLVSSKKDTSHPFERRLSANDFSPTAVYNPRINIGQINKLVPYFFKDTRGINPILINTMVNFDFDSNEYLKTYTRKTSAELLSTEVLKIVFASIPNEPEFNAGVFMNFKLNNGYFLSYSLPLKGDDDKGEETDDNLNLHFKHRVHIKSKIETISAKQFDVESQYINDGMPELDYILN